MKRYNRWYILLLSSLLLVICNMLYAVRIASDTLLKMSRLQVTKQLTAAKQAGDKELIEQLTKRLAEMPPDPPPAPEKGEGRYYWLPLHEEGTGEWIWQDKSGKTYVVSLVSQAPLESSLVGPSLTKPSEPPKDAQGPGEWLWRPEQKGEGQWIWVSEDKTKQPIAGPRTPDAQGVPGIVQGPEAVVQEKQITPQPSEGPLPPSTGALPLPEPGNGPPPAPSEGPPAPSGPGAPKPTPIAGKPALPKAITIKERILSAGKILSKEELEQLSPEQQQASNDVVFNVLTKLAHEVFIRPQENQSMTLEINKKKQTFDSPFQAYKAFIQEAFVRDIGMAAGFEKRRGLLNILGEQEEEAKQDNLMASIDDTLAKKPNESVELFLSRVKSKIDQYVQDISALITQILFIDEKHPQLRASEIEKKIHHNIVMLVVNTALSQRFSVPQKAITVRGDIKYIDNPTPVQSILNTSVVEQFITHFVKELVAAADRLKGHEQLKSLDGRLMLMVLRDELNLLRLNPEFYLFERLSGSKAREEANQKSGLEATGMTPLLDALDVFDEKYVAFFAQTRNLLLALKYQLFFEYEVGEIVVDRYFNTNATTMLDDLEASEKMGWTEKSLMQLRDQTAMFQQAVEDYYAEIKNIIIERKQSIDAYTFINQSLQNIKTYEGIQEILESLKKIGGTPERNKTINDIIRELKQPKELFNPNVDTIMSLFKTLTGKQTVEFEKNIRTLVKRFIDKNKNAAQVVQALEQVIQEKKIPFVQYLIEELKKRKVNLGRYTEKFTGVTRTAKDVYEALGSLAGRTTVAQVIKEKEFYKLVEPYGILMMIFRDWPQEQQKKLVAERIDVLFKSLKLLNSSTERVPTGVDAENVMSLLTQYADIINTIHPYANKLSALIDALQKNTFDRVTQEVKAIVAVAATGAENTHEFDDIMAHFYRSFAQAHMQQLIDLIQLLNKGQAEAAISTLPVQGSNIYAYIGMNQAFDPLLNLLTKDGQPVKSVDLDIPAIKNAITQAIDTIIRATANKVTDSAAQKSIETNLKIFFDNEVEKLAALKIHTPAEVVGIPTPGAPSEGSGPPPPPTDGGPPLPPGVNNGPPPPPTQGGPPPPITLPKPKN